MVLDEPALGLDMGEVQRVNAWLRELAQQGNPVMLSAAKHLDAHPDRPFATLRVTRKAIPFNDVQSLLICLAALALWNPGPLS